MEQSVKSPEGKLWSPLIRACLYVVMFEDEPLHSVDRVMQMIRNGSMPGGTPEEYVQAISEALSSNTVLTRLVGELYPDRETLWRSYLAELGRQLEP